MALYTNVKNIDINYIIKYFHSKEECIRVLYGRSFYTPYGDTDYSLSNSLIIEPVPDKQLKYQDGCRTVTIECNGDICINPWYDKLGVNCCKEIYDYINSYNVYVRDNKLKCLI